MFRSLLKSKIHRATITEADINYTGSISIDKDLLIAVDLWSGEKVLVVDHTNGSRLETYVIEAPNGSGTIGMNGAAARLMSVGDKISIMSFGFSEVPIKAKKILCTEDNKVNKYL
jgi:aspartate 1-decarboxylase